MLSANIHVKEYCGIVNTELQVILVYYNSGSARDQSALRRVGCCIHANKTTCFSCSNFL